MNKSNNKIGNGETTSAGDKRNEIKLPKIVSPKRDITRNNKMDDDELPTNRYNDAT